MRRWRVGVEGWRDRGQGEAPPVKLPAGHSGNVKVAAGNLRLRHPNHRT